MSHGSEFLFSVDSEVSEIDTNDWSEWIIENYFSWFCRTKNIYFCTQGKKNFRQKPFLEEINWRFEILEEKIYERKHYTENCTENGPESSEETAERSIYFIFNLFSSEICHSVSLRWFYCFWNIRFWSLRIFLRPFECSNFEFSNSAIDRDPIIGWISIFLWFPPKRAIL